MGFPHTSGKDSYSAGDAGVTSGVRSFLPLLHSCLEILLNREPGGLQLRLEKSWTRLSDQTAAIEIGLFHTILPRLCILFHDIHGSMSCSQNINASMEVPLKPVLFLDMYQSGIVESDVIIFVLGNLQNTCIGAAQIWPFLPPGRGLFLWFSCLFCSFDGMKPDWGQWHHCSFDFIFNNYICWSFQVFAICKNFRRKSPFLLSIFLMLLLDIELLGSCSSMALKNNPCWSLCLQHSHSVGCLFFSFVVLLCSKF